MKAITIKQPYASLLFSGAKKWETRPYRPRSVEIGEEIAVHAGRTLDVGALSPYALRRLGLNHLSFDWNVTDAAKEAEVLPTGMLIGLVRLEAVERALSVKASERDFGDFRAGRWAWRLRPTLQLKPGVRVKGALSLWSVPDHIANYIEQGRPDRATTHQPTHRGMLI